MQLQILGSSSAGNCYILTSGRGERLLIECGIRWQKVMQAIGYDVKSVAGCLVSHEHGDHAKEVGAVLRSGIEVYMSGGTADALNQRPGVLLHPMAGMEIYRIGDFLVRPFGVEHDAREPFGFLISHPEMGVLLFATDTYFLQYRFKGLTNIMIECNYSTEILAENVREGKLPSAVRNRVIRSHMSLQNCIKTLKANDLSKVNNIILLHLSEGNSEAGKFREDVTEATGKNVLTAHKDMIIENFNTTPF